tara:strand:+ start:667 stop:1146 length:480 start_codon:yes stop_codon:yes gene_type:complete
MALQLGWNVSSSLEDQFDNTILSASWRSVRFVDTSKDFVPQSRGVYMISVKSDVKKGIEPFCNFETPAYVGMSTDIRQRFITHTKSNNPEALWKRLFALRNHTHFWFASFPNKSKGELRQIEQKLIDIFGSPLNKINSAKFKVVSGDAISGAAITQGNI